ncbi:MAG: hypothetical protein H0U45_13850 [Tatlockia sp.]|nr:hypothetical protein [Tatlockia sp.]
MVRTQDTSLPNCDRVAELARLRMLENNISDEVKSVESAYQHLLSA